MADEAERLDACGSALIGVWSTRPLFPSDPVDERLIFKPDGTGRLEIYNWMLCEFYNFRWFSPALGRITLKSHDYAGLDDFHPEPDESVHLDNAPYEISAQRNAAGEERVVLKLCIDKHTPENFVLIQRGVEGFEEPDLT